MPLLGLGIYHIVSRFPKMCCCLSARYAFKYTMVVRLGSRVAMRTSMFANDLLPRLPIPRIQSYQSCTGQRQPLQATSSRPMSGMAWRTECNPGNANRACGNFTQSLLVNQASRDQHYHAVSVARLRSIHGQEEQRQRGSKCER
jgi:hypothetical protein